MDRGKWSSPKTGAVLSTLLASLMLGSSYTAVKIGVSETDPYMLGAIIMVIGILVLLPVMYFRGTLNGSMFKRWEFWSASLVNTGVVAPMYIGLTMTTASATGLIIGTNVIFVAILSRMVFAERIGRRRSFGIFLALAGLITLTTHWDVSTLHGSALLGNLLILISSACIGCVVVLSRVALRTLTADQWSLGLHFLLPVTLLTVSLMMNGSGIIGEGSWYAIIFTGVVCSTIPTMLWTGSLRHLSVVTTATILMCESVFSVLIGWLVLNEALDSLVILGAIMIFAAVFIVAREN